MLCIKQAVFPTEIFNFPFSTINLQNYTSLFGSVFFCLTGAFVASLSVNLAKIESVVRKQVRMYKRSAITEARLIV